MNASQVAVSLLLFLGSYLLVGSAYLGKIMPTPEAPTLWLVQRSWVSSVKACCGLNGCPPKKEKNILKEDKQY
jgi:hypothetical protein